MIRRSLKPLVALAALALAGQASAQGSSPGTAQTGNPSPPAVAPSRPLGGGFKPPESCLKEFTPLRDETLLRGRLMRAAGERHAPNAEACRLVHDYELAQSKMIDFAVAHAETCGIPAKITNQLRAGHESTVALMKKVCTLTQRAPVEPGDRASLIEPVRFGMVVQSMVTKDNAEPSNLAAAIRLPEL
ncbi:MULTISPECIES: hypothetical protein [unclassified Bradyrhizobium]|uniref:hypothetical protein n=1 Tax=unclassified Bradyrhizobium TaxID=2631580 RepID=UPI0028EFFE1A|nr:MULTISPECIES: hypothetical protein [unclassified Bradyrhizobium]